MTPSKPQQISKRRADSVAAPTRIGYRREGPSPAIAECCFFCVTNILVVVINGIAGNFLLDTGATYVSVTPNFASKAHLKIEAGTQLPIKTVGGAASADLRYASTVDVGKAEAQGVPVAVIRGAVDPFGAGLDGLLGMSFLARFKVNLSQNTIELTAIPLR